MVVIQIIDALSRLVQVLIDSFGKIPTIVGILLFLAVAIAWRVYSDKRRDKMIDALIAEKDRTIQRLAESERQFRVHFFKEQAGWSDDEVNLFVMKNEFQNTPDARRSLEDREKGTEESDSTYMEEKA